LPITSIIFILRSKFKTAYLSKNLILSSSVKSLNSKFFLDKIIKTKVSNHISYKIRKYIKSFLKINRQKRRYYWNRYKEQNLKLLRLRKRKIKFLRRKKKLLIKKSFIKSKRKRYLKVLKRKIFKKNGFGLLKIKHKIKLKQRTSLKKFFIKKKLPFKRKLRVKFRSFNPISCKRKH